MEQRRGKRRKAKKLVDEQKAKWLMNAKRNRGIAARKAKVFHLHFESDLRGDRFPSPPHHLPGLLRSFRVFFLSSSQLFCCSSASLREMSA